MAFHHSPRIVLDSLEEVWDPSNPTSYVSGSGTAYNVVNTSQTGTVLGSPVLLDTNVKVWDFDGTDDRIEINKDRSGYGTSISVSTWVKRDTIGNYAYVIMLGAGSGTTSFSISAWASGNPFAWYSYNGSDSLITDGDGVLGRWYNIVVTVASNAKKIYQDGILIKSDTHTFTGFNNSFGRVGRYQDGTTYPWDGSISQTLIYSKELSAAEVLQNYNALKGRFE
jgi:hypothetical protein